MNLTKSRLVTLDEAAEALRKTPAQMRWMRHQGTGPRSAKVGGRVMYLSHEVDTWILEQFEKESA